MKFLRLIVRNALRNKLRTGLTVGGTAFLMFVLLFIMTALTEMEAWQGEAAKHHRVVVQHSTGLATPLPIELENYLRGEEVSRHAEHLQKMNWFGGYWQDKKNFFANFGVDPEPLRQLWDELDVPDAVYAAWKGQKTGTIVGQSLAKKFGWKVGQRITLEGTIYPCNPELEIVGIFTARDIRQEEQLFFHWTYLDELMNGRKIVGTFWMKAKTPEDIPKLKELIDGHTRNSSDPTETVTEKEFADQFMAMMGNIKLLVFSLGTIVLVIMIMMNANTVAMSARERVTEIAVLRTLGFTGGQIGFLVLAESVLVSLVGLILPLGAALVFFNVMKLSPAAQFFPFFLIEPPTIVIATAAAVISGLVAAAVPASLAVRRRIVDGLRQVV
ncbi:MAG TPA: ABC transporter permease [Planctomycetota bacterium]|nr:ABC transporter permease [Planctomycetota bacterium]